MKQKHTSHRRTVALLLAAAALPLNPAVAQDVTPAPAQPPIVDVTPPAPEPAPAPVIAPSAPQVAAPAPVASAPAPGPSAEEARTTETRSRASATNGRRAPAATRTASAATTRSAAPAPATTAPAPAPATAPLAATIPTTNDTAAPASAAAPAAEGPAAPAQPAQSSRGSIWPWLLGALVLIGAAALLMRRRRRDEQVYYEEAVDEPEVVAAPIITPSLAEQTIAPPAVAPEVAAAAIPAAAETGTPSIALEMRPVRAGVNADDAVVEFELTVDNRGTAAARDVRISTWMFAAGHASEAERALIEPRDEAELPAVTIASGDAKRIETSVALSTARIAEDALLPVVVAEAHYRLPDGSEAQTIAAFEVGVPVDDDLAHFDVENPSGLHDDVVARPHREAIDA